MKHLRLPIKFVIMYVFCVMMNMTFTFVLRRYAGLKLDDDMDILMWNLLWMFMSIYEAIVFTPCYPRDLWPNKN